MQNFVVVATPTNYDPDTNRFDTSSVDIVVDEALAFASDALVVIKSTVPVGYTQGLQGLCSTKSVIFSPSFLERAKRYTTTYIRPGLLWVAQRS